MVPKEQFDRRRTSPELHTHPEQVTADKCKFSSKVGACVAATNPTSSLVLRAGKVNPAKGPRGQNPGP